MSDPYKWAACFWLLAALVPSAAGQDDQRSLSKLAQTRKSKNVLTDSISLLYLNMGALSITSTAVNQTNATVVIYCADSTGLAFSNVSLGVAADALTLSSTTATFLVGQQVGYLQYGRSISCSIDVQYYKSDAANLTDIALLSAGNASCWFGYSLFVASSDSSTSATSWTCSTSGVSYVLLCEDCSTATASTSSKSSGMSTGQIETVCIVVGCSLLVALVVICACSRNSSWRRNDARDTQHLPEDAAKEVNLRPPKFFVATSASQRNIDSPRGSKPSVLRTTAPPVVIVSYGSSSTPTAHNFHHGVYALAQPEMAFQVQPMHEPLGDEAARQKPHSPLEPLPEEPPFQSSTGDVPAVTLSGTP